MLANRDPLHEQIYAQARTLVDNLELLFGPAFFDEAERLRRRLDSHARNHALVLHSDDENEAAGTATDLVSALFPGETPIPDEWWATPLGRACAMTAGHPTAENVSYSVAGAMLGGIDRQRVAALVDEGKLDGHPDAGVTVVSVQQRLRSME